jgi:hypothetical protein
VKPEIRLSAEVYDKLKAEAEKVGGVGKLYWYRFDRALRRDDVTCPVCINGIAVVAGLHTQPAVVDEDGDAPDPVNVCGIDMVANDHAVGQLFDQGKYTYDQYDIRRVSWDDYVRELNIVREEPVEVLA